MWGPVLSLNMRRKSSQGLIGSIRKLAKFVCTMRVLGEGEICSDRVGRGETLFYGGGHRAPRQRPLVGLTYNETSQHKLTQSKPPGDGEGVGNAPVPCLENLHFPFPVSSVCPAPPACHLPCVNALQVPKAVIKWTLFCEHSNFSG